MSNYLAWQSDNFITIFIGLVLLEILILVILSLWKMFHNNETLKYEFITIIAHKYRTPLTQVKWLCENLLNSEKDEYKKESLRNINQSNDKLIKLTNSLIEITDSDRSATASYSFETVHLCDFVRLVAEPYKTLFHEKNIFFSVECVAEDIKVKIDKQRIEFVLQSLLENACTYTSPGKNVRVIVERSFRKGLVSVIDQGIGLSGGDLSRIFTKFFRSDSARRVDTEGFGISLFLSKAIMRRHKGKIQVSSDGPEKGAKFELILKVVK